MLVSYSDMGQKTIREFSTLYIRTDSPRGLFSPEMCSLVGVTTSGEEIVLLSNLQRKKADKIYNRIQKRMNNPFWMGGVIHV